MQNSYHNHTQQSVIRWIILQWNHFLLFYEKIKRFPYSDKFLLLIEIFLKNLNFSLQSKNKIRPNFSKPLMILKNILLHSFSVSR
jgi:hypothetical protein